MGEKAGSQRMTKPNPVLSMMANTIGVIVLIIKIEDPRAKVKRKKKRFQKRTYILLRGTMS